MALSRKFLEEEIKLCKTAIETHQQGVDVQTVVMKALKIELEKLPPEKKKEQKPIVGVS